MPEGHPPSRRRQVPFITPTPPGLGPVELGLLDKFRAQAKPPRTPDDGWVYYSPIAPATAPTNEDVDVLSPAFGNGWGNVAGKEPLRFHLDNFGNVEVEGAVAGGSPGTTIGDPLPPGFRPEYTIRRSIATDTVGKTGVWIIDPDGIMTYEGTA